MFHRYTDDAALFMETFIPLFSRIEGPLAREVCHFESVFLLKTSFIFCSPHPLLS